MDLIENLPFNTERVIGSRARLGCVVLASDYTIEHEFRSVLNNPEMEGVDLYCARIANSPNINPESLAAMGPALRETAERILPGDTVDALAFGCTSASMVLGPSHVNDILMSAKPMAETTNPVTATVAAMTALNAKRIAVLTPYRRDVNTFIAKGLADQGLEIAVFGSFNEESDTTVSAINEASLTAAMDRLAQYPDIDAIFVSCTSIRLLHAVQRLEERLEIPVTSSNHAMIWHSLRLANIKNRIANLGRLYQI